MRFKQLILIAVVVTLAGCGTSPYIPQEYRIKDGRVGPLTVSGNVEINNTQSSKEIAIVYSYGGTSLASNYQDISQAMVDQAKKELKKNSQSTSAKTKKTIDISVSNLVSVYKFMYWNSEITYSVKLGDGKFFSKKVKNGSGNLLQDLNGCIAKAVIDLYKDERVVAYLKS